ncbi:MAG: LptF/LptG family permease, partial [Pirellulaceae bacterium]|nr:LptF/LptG family permease [Pirellulaceae bacterium]
DRTAPLIALVAAIFSVAFMQRSNELTAISAAGISKRRIAKPLVLTTLAIVVLTMVNRETLIPAFRNLLAMQPQDLSAGKARSVAMIDDHETGISIRGKEVMPVNQEIRGPVFTLPPELGHLGSTISAGLGHYLPENQDHPAGYLLSQVTSDIKPGANLTDSPQIVFLPEQNSWLGSEQVFIASSVDTLYLAFPKEMSRNATLGEMVQRSHDTSSWSNQLKVDIHWRIVQPIFDMSILLIGLPLVISRGERNLFFSAGICLTVVMLMFLVAIACQGMGASRVLSSASLAAWLPIILFLPFAAMTYRLLDY